jgi:hypothetical protein
MINVEFNQNKKQKSFPKLMISNDGQIVLFIIQSIGTVVYSNSNNCKVGYYSNAWNMDIYNDFDGEITLKNE